MIACVAAMNTTFVLLSRNAPAESCFTKAAPERQSYGMASCPTVARNSVPTTPRCSRSNFDCDTHAQLTPRWTLHLRPKVSQIAMIHEYAMIEQDGSHSTLSYVRDPIGRLSRLCWQVSIRCTKSLLLTTLLRTNTPSSFERVPFRHAYSPRRLRAMS